ncbi:MAG TPA: hypothetical protein VF603_00440 [Allosphingosinicella sp.]|jgi:hypothetical protein
MGNPPALPFRFGCALALAVAASFVIAVAAGHSYISALPFLHHDWGYYLAELCLIAVPFGALAVARTRDWLAWAVAVFLTAAVWGWHLHDLSRQTGVNIGLGIIMMLVAPLLISGFSVAIAGMRGKIPDWGQEPDS